MFLFIAKQIKAEVERATFKYISCSYLSAGPLLKAFLGNEFKYISCSYLSFPI